MNEKLAVQMGRGLRTARLRAGLTCAQVAAEVRLPPEAYARMERGKLLPSVPTLHALCLALRAGTDWLWHGDPAGA